METGPALDDALTRPRSVGPTMSDEAHTNDQPTVVQLTDIEKAFAEQQVLNRVSLSIRRGEVVSIVGQSGGGKTTLLRCINLLEQPDRGEITVAGETVFSDRLLLRERELERFRRRVGMVFQRFHLFPHLSAIENITLPLIRGLGVDPDAAVTTAHMLLTRVGLPKKALARPSTLSGGEQQRVAIARAMALRPEVLLFDEPTSSLDPESTAEVNKVMAELAADGMTMIIVTHELRFAQDAADRLVFIDAGSIVEEGPVEEVLLNPQQRRTQDFLRSFNRTSA